MKWEEFIRRVGELPLIDSEILLAGKPNPQAIKVQISRWQKTGKLIQLKRSIYLLGKLYRKTDIYEPYIAAVLKKPSYISLEKALEFHNLIPEAVAVYTSVTPKKQGKFVSEIGVFDYRHIRNSLFWGYESVTVNKQTAFFASPEKALLDLIYLKGGGVSLDYLEGLRLQNTEKINRKKLFAYAQRFNKPGILTAAEIIKKYVDSLQGEEKTL